VIGLRAGTAFAFATLVTAGWRAAPGAARIGPSRGRAAAVTDSFPHERHGRLFTACDNCHQGLSQNDWRAHFPPPELCSSCHDGTVQRRVDWTPRPMPPSLVSFRHPDHPEIPCESCHAASDSAAPMQVGRAVPARCLVCHASDAPSHLEQTSCTPCHVRLPDSRALATADLARLPKPPSHDSNWVLAHREQAPTSEACAVCHAREFCASCHPNAAAVAPIQALGRDERVAALARTRRPRYPMPVSHRTETFGTSHGLAARTSVVECANCHTRESCRTCHLEPSRVEPVAQLPSRVRGGAPGVNLAGRRPEDHVPGFAREHRTAAAGGDQRCSRCHAPSFCSNCHDGTASPDFHGPDFVQRHSQAAYNQEAECASCHQTQVFCRNCHLQTGRSQPSLGRDAAYHDRANGGNWLFGHPAAARRSIETCATCHQQAFCIQCHSATQGWKVSPHGDRFDRSLGQKNPAMCLYCHTLGIPRQ
jgi:predicted CXXCH cytochrome family protein